MTTPLRGALIGCGYISEQQLQAWQQIPEADIVALCDVDLEKAHYRGRQFGIETIYNDYGRMLDGLDLDFVDIATRPNLHLPMVKAAAERGLHVLCQKPIAETMEEAQQMVAVCQEAGVQFMVNENYRHQAWFRQTKALIEDGRLGTPHYARFYGRWRATLPTPNFAGQDYFRDMPRLLIFEMGIHLYDTARYLFGEPDTVFADLRRVSPDIQGEDMALSLARFARLTFLFDMNWFAVLHDHTGNAAHGRFVVEGSEGTAALSQDGLLRLYRADGSEEWQFPQDTIEQSFVATQRHFIECLQTGQEPETSGA
ncbi:MAG: Gfo/Idh/MocA family oxidoreductase, partial [Candidatus Promineifilaceae bacterium]